jgi:hypothetical protein
MHSKNAPTLYDNFFNAINKDSVEPEQKQMVDHMRKAERYVFDTKASHILGHMIKTMAPLILQQHEFARPPYSNTWVEIDMMAYMEALEEHRDLRDPTLDTRLGYLVMRDHILFFVSETAHTKPLITPYWYVLHEPISFEQELDLAQKLGLSRLTLREHLLGTSGLPKDWWRSPEAESFCRGHHFMMGQQLKESSPGTRRKVLRGAAGSLKQAIAILLLLSRPGSGVIALSNQERRHGLVRGHSRVLAPHHKVTIHLEGRKALQRIQNNLQTGQHHRYHSVRGHWCQTRRITGCEHDWEPVNPDRYECLKGCGAKRWWKKNHHRGDISLGEVTKEYEVTK